MDKIKKISFSLNKQINHPIKEEEKKENNSCSPIGFENVKCKKYTGPERLTCTHCGEKIPKPNIPVDYIISCDKCFRPLDLPAKYYKK